MSGRFRVIPTGRRAGKVKRLLAQKPVDWADGDLCLGRWYAVPGNPEGETSSGGWTISPDPNRPGWATNGGRDGCGMPRAVAEDLARRLNATAEAT